MRPAPDVAASHTLGDLFSIKRGTAIGANSFFILERPEVICKGIPVEFLRPNLSSSRHLPDTVIDTNPDSYPRLEQPVAIIDCNLPAEVIQRRHPDFWRYLKQGKAQGIYSGYLAGRRIPCHSQEKRGAAPFLCTYIGRRGRCGNPMRIFWNKWRTVAADVYLMLYAKSEMRSALAGRADLYPIVFSHL
jgi:hypothetical protein